MFPLPSCLATDRNGAVFLFFLPNQHKRGFLHFSISNFTYCFVSVVNEGEFRYFLTNLKLFSHIFYIFHQRQYNSLFRH
jgi:hypothetical protein